MSRRRSQTFKRDKGSSWRRSLGSVVAVVVLAAVSAVPASADPGAAAGGAFTCDFGASTQLNPLQIAPILERDRMYMSARPGFIRKFIPLRIDPASGELFSGGRYLFGSYQDALDYKSWILHDFVLDGTEFFDRPYFLQPECHAWQVIGVADIAPYDRDQVVVRTERLHVPGADQQPILSARWGALVAEARQRGLTGVWLLYDKPEQLVSLVYFANRTVPLMPDSLDAISLLALQQQPPLGDAFADQHWIRSFDQTEWVLTLWFPFARGDHGRPSTWPNSPPLPSPYPGDGVCDPSDPIDCRPTCGNGIADAGETTDNCPSDVRPFKDEHYTPPQNPPSLLSCLLLDCSAAIPGIRSRVALSPMQVSHATSGRALLLAEGVGSS
jgi:hypothetical protein